MSRQKTQENMRVCTDGGKATHEPEMSLCKVEGTSDNFPDITIYP